ncbi:serine/threonine protein kinase [Mycobacterium sp. 1274756.6]|nr:serine/threonine protein kinase [Mycobacterium sp. 1274756.6]
MGSVYLAAHPTLPRYDALKVLSTELSRDPDFRARFIREADVAAALSHPQIVAVHNRGQTDDGQLWIAMQFVDGTDADEALRAGTMTPVRAVHIVREVAKGLDFAHAHNVVHRDIKPANFLLSGPVGDQERVLLGDFGIARALDDVGLTATGSVMATIAYAAPEVLAGSPIDGRADIYSLGCTLFRLLTGKPPFANTNGPAAQMMAHLQAAPPRVTDTVRSLPPALDEVIAIAMAKDPARRFATAGALADAAAAALHDPGHRDRTLLAPVPTGQVSAYPGLPAAAPTMSAAPPRRTRRRGVLVGAIAGVAVLVVAAISAVALRSHGDSAPDDGTPSAAAPSPAVQGPPATDVPVSALPSILLTGSEIPGNSGDTAVVLEHQATELADDSATVDNPSCVGAWAPAQRAAYATVQPVGVAVQELRALYQKVWQDSVTQAVVAFSSVDDTSLSLQMQRMAWEGCAGKTIVITPTGDPAQTWRFGQPVNNAGVYTLEATLDGGSAVCQHGIQIQGNVAIDIRRCGPPGTVDVSALVNATAAKVPRQG